MAKTAQIHYIGDIQPIVDKVFFRKEQISVGTVLVCRGRRTNPNTTWEVRRIFTFRLVRGQYKSKKVNTVECLLDAVELYCPQKKKYMELSFQYLSYSAIWQIR